MKNRPKLSVIISANPKAGADCPTKYCCEIKLINKDVTKKALNILQEMMRLPFDDLEVKYPDNNTVEVHGTGVKPYEQEILDAIFDAIKNNMKAFGLSK